MRTALFVLSALLVFGTAGLILGAVGVADPASATLPVGWLIHSRAPAAIVALVVLGASLGVATLLGSPSWWKAPVVGLEVVLALAAAWYFVARTTVPAYEFRVTVGQAFPSYALVDQDGSLHEYPPPAGLPGPSPAFYIFYRGDW